MWLQFAKLWLQNMQADMTDFLPRRAYAPKIFALAALLSLGGCIDSVQPLLNGAPARCSAIGRTLKFYVLRDGAAREPTAETFAWRDGRYVPIQGTASDLHDFTLQAFAGADLIVQSLRAGHPAEYGIARKLADGTYLLFAVDENDADAATRDKYCGQGARRCVPRGDNRGGAGVGAGKRRHAAFERRTRRSCGGPLD